MTYTDTWTMKKDGNITFEIIDVPVQELAQPEFCNADVYYKMRYTFEPEDTIATQKQWCKSFVNELRPYMVGGKYTLGVEGFTKGMKPTKPHVHIHFASRTKKDTIVKQLKRLYNIDGHMMLSKHTFALGIETTVNFEKFWRYPLKQQKGDTAILESNSGFTEEDITTLRDQAYAVWLTSCEVYEAKAQKEEQSKELQERLFAYLDKLDNTDTLSLKVGIQKFYILEEKRPFNKQTALGYLYNYQITKSLITHEQLAQLW